MRNTKFFNSLEPLEGSLKIQKYFPDGRKEDVFEQKNLIVLVSRQKILNELYSTPLTISAISCAGFLVSVTTLVSHGLTTGDLVIVDRVNPLEYNGIFEVNVIDATHFQYYSRTSIVSAGSGADMAIYPTVKPDPINSLKIGIGGGIDSRSIIGCSVSISTTNLTTTDSPGFLISDVGQNVTIQGAGVGGDPLNVIVTAFNSSTSVTISESASTTVSNINVTIGQGLYPKREDPSQTDLISEVTELPITYTVNSTAPSVTFIADADQSTANGLLLTEAGLFKLSGDIFNVKNHPGIPKTSDFGVHYVWTIKYA